MEANLSFFNINIRSILASGEGSRLDHLINRCVAENYDIISLTETHLSENICDNEVEIENYQMFRHDRLKHGRRGGGVACYIKNHIPVKLLKNLYNEQIESIWIQVSTQNRHNTSNKNCIIGTCYRPPNQSGAEQKYFIDYLASCFETLENMKCNFVLLGDFNDTCSSWNDNHSNSEIGLKLYNLTMQYQLTQLIDEPTRQDHLLDLLITNCSESMDAFGVGDPLDNLDHLPITGKLKIKGSQIHKPRSFTRFVRSYTDENLDLLYYHLNSIQWYRVFHDHQEIDDLLHIFYEILNEAIEYCIPSKQVIIRPKDKPGMTSYVRTLFRKRDRAHKIAIKTKTTENLQNFKKARKLAKSEWKKAKLLYEEKVHKKLNDPNLSSKTYWKQIKKCYGTSKKNSIPVLMENDKIFSEAIDKANLLNTYFVSQSTLDLKTEPNLPKQSSNPNPRISINRIETTVEEVYKILTKLNIGKANGPDDISNTILKHCAAPLADPIATIINKSLETGTFPTIWKNANVIPVFKNGNKEDVSNYRPISLLSNISKIFERIVFERIYEFCEENKLLTSKNSGFEKR